jgi:hypothetical protein
MPATAPALFTSRITLLGCIALAFALGSAPSAALGAEQSEVKGVNPADNLTKFELLPKFATISSDNDVTVAALTLKYDRAIKGVYGVNVELPLSHFDAPFGSDTGIGDLNVRARRQFRDGRWTYIVGLETVLPIASADTLGFGKLQVNPSAVAVYAISAQTFVAGVAKHLFSVAGSSGRDDVVQAQYRMLLAHSTKDGWWMLADPQLWVDYDRGARSQFSFEAEVGRMIRPLTGVWLRAGGRLGGNWHREDWTVSGGIRFISF